MNPPQTLLLVMSLLVWALIHSLHQSSSVKQKFEQYTMLIMLTNMEYVLVLYPGIKAI